MVRYSPVEFPLTVLTVLADPNVTNQVRTIERKSTSLGCLSASNVLPHVNDSSELGLFGVGYAGANKGLSSKPVATEMPPNIV